MKMKAYQLIDDNVNSNSNNNHYDHHHHNNNKTMSGVQNFMPPLAFELKERTIIVIQKKLIQQLTYKICSMV